MVFKINLKVEYLKEKFTMSIKVQWIYVLVLGSVKMKNIKTGTRNKEKQEKRKV